MMSYGYRTCGKAGWFQGELSREGWKLHFYQKKIQQNKRETKNPQALGLWIKDEEFSQAVKGFTTIIVLGQKRQCATDIKFQAKRQECEVDMTKITKQSCVAYKWLFLIRAEYDWSYVWSFSNFIKTTIWNPIFFFVVWSDVNSIPWPLSIVGRDNTLSERVTAL